MDNETKSRIESTGASGVVAQSAGNSSVIVKSEMTDPTSEPPPKRVKLEPVDGTSSGVKVETSASTQTNAAETPPPTECQIPKPGASECQPVSAQPDGNLKTRVSPVTTTVVAGKAPAAHIAHSAGTASIVTPSPAPSRDSNDSVHSVAAAPNGTVAKPAIEPKTEPPAPPPASGAPERTDQETMNTIPKEVPLKSTTMSHLKTKYTAELEYMLREFRKLERQLLGAKGAAQLEESAGSRERREKLHSFILHLEDTVRQIETGCKLEAEGKSTVNVTTSVDAAQGSGGEEAKKQMAEASALTNLTKEKEEEENVQKLEEHILANLLPVKVRLKKQLAAQQGASRNPAGMPAPRRGMLQPAAAERGQGTFAAAAEQRRKQAEAARLAAQQEEEQAVRRVSDPTQFGKPLGGGGSSLTQKLHGQTLGSKKRPHGHGVGRPQEPDETTVELKTEKQVLYGGMVPGSTQHKSGVLAASGVHEMVIDDAQSADVGEQKTMNAALEPATARTPPSIHAGRQEKAAVDTRKQVPREAAPVPSTQQISPRAPVTSSKTPVKALDANLTNEEKRKLRKKRRKKKLLRLKKRREKERQRQVALHQQTQATQLSSKTSAGKKKAAVGKGQGKKKGPRSVEYICALCSEAYTSTCDYNPWWALAQHECPKCRKSQIPRIDITSPANAIEYHPALLAHADDNGAGGAAAAASIIHVEQPPAISPAPFSSKPFSNAPPDAAGLGVNSDSESDLSELSDDSLSACSSDSDDSAADLQSMTAAERAEHESFGHDYKGPVMSDDHAGRLLILMGHASTCPCRHKLPQHRDVCTSTKYMMLHVRDCPGTTSTFDVCPYPWCRKVKHLLYHLVSCIDPEQCKICNPTNIPQSMMALVGLNKFRVQKYRERLIAAVKVTSAGRTKGIPIPQPTLPPTLSVAREKVQPAATNLHTVNRKSAGSVRLTTAAARPALATKPTGHPSRGVAQPAVTRKPLVAQPPIARQPALTKDKVVVKGANKLAKPSENQIKPAATTKPSPKVPASVIIKPKQTPVPSTTTPATVATARPAATTQPKLGDTSASRVAVQAVPMLVDCAAAVPAPEKVAPVSHILPPVQAAGAAQPAQSGTIAIAASDNRTTQRPETALATSNAVPKQETLIASQPSHGVVVAPRTATSQVETQSVTKTIIHSLPVEATAPSVASGAVQSPQATAMEPTKPVAPVATGSTQATSKMEIAPAQPVSAAVQGVVQPSKAGAEATQTHQAPSNGGTPNDVEASSTRTVAVPHPPPASTYAPGNSSVPVSHTTPASAKIETVQIPLKAPGTAGTGRTPDSSAATNSGLPAVQLAVSPKLEASPVAPETTAEVGVKRPATVNEAAPSPKLAGAVSAQPVTDHVPSPPSSLTAVPPPKATVPPALQTQVPQPLSTAAAVESKVQAQSSIGQGDTTSALLASVDIALPVQTSVATPVTASASCVPATQAAEVAPKGAPEIVQSPLAIAHQAAQLSSQIEAVHVQPAVEAVHNLQPNVSGSPGLVSQTTQLAVNSDKVTQKPPEVACADVHVPEQVVGVACPIKAEAKQPDSSQTLSATTLREPAREQNEKLKTETKLATHGDSVGSSIQIGQGSADSAQLAPGKLEAEAAEPTASNIGADLPTPNSQTGEPIAVKPRCVNPTELKQTGENDNQKTAAAMHPGGELGSTAMPVVVQPVPGDSGTPSPLQGQASTTGGLVTSTQEASAGGSQLSSGSNEGCATSATDLNGQSKSLALAETNDSKAAETMKTGVATKQLEDGTGVSLHKEAGHTPSTHASAIQVDDQVAKQEDSSPSKEPEARGSIPVQTSAPSLVVVEKKSNTPLPVESPPITTGLTPATTVVPDVAAAAKKKEEPSSIVKPVEAPEVTPKHAALARTSASTGLQNSMEGPRSGSLAERPTGTLQSATNGVNLDTTGSSHGQVEKTAEIVKVN